MRKYREFYSLLFRYSFIHYFHFVVLLLATNLALILMMDSSGSLRNCSLNVARRLIIYLLNMLLLVALRTFTNCQPFILFSILLYTCFFQNWILFRYVCKINFSDNRLNVLAVKIILGLGLKSYLIFMLRISVIKIDIWPLEFLGVGLHNYMKFLISKSINARLALQNKKIISNYYYYSFSHLSLFHSIPSLILTSAH